MPILVDDDYILKDPLGLLGGKKPEKPKTTRSYPSGRARIAHAKKYLQDRHGLSEHAAAAVAGHGFAESGLDTSRTGDNGTAIGAFQHRLDRADNLKTFAGDSFQDLERHLDFVVHELGTSERYAGNALRDASTLEEASTAMMHFLRPAGYSRNNPTAGLHYDRRTNYARSAMSGQTKPGDPDAQGLARLAPADPEAPATAKAGSLTFRHKGQDTLAPDFTTILTETSAAVGRPLHITSGYRSPNHPVERRKRTGPGQHSKGTAADISMKGMSLGERQDLIYQLRRRGVNRFITYSNSPDMLHVDMKDQRGDGSAHFMFDRTSRRMNKAPEWYRKAAATAKGIKVGDIAIAQAKPKEPIVAAPGYQASDPMGLYRDRENPVTAAAASALELPQDGPVPQQRPDPNAAPPAQSQSDPQQTMLDQLEAQEPGRYKLMPPDEYATWYEQNKHTYEGNFAKEVGKGLAAGAVNVAGAALKGGAEPTSRDPAEEKAVHGLIDELDRVKDMTPEEWAEFVVRADQAVRGRKEMDIVGAAVRIRYHDETSEAARQSIDLDSILPRTELPDHPLYRAGERVQQLSQDYLAAARNYEDSWTRLISEGLGSTIPFLATAPLGPAAGPVAGATLGSFASTGEAIDRAVAAGATQDQIIQAAKLGRFPGLTEQVPVEVLFERVPLPVAGRMASAIGKVLTQAAVEGGQEAVQQAAQNLIENYVYNPDRDVLDGVAEAAGVGAIVGGTLSAGVQSGAALSRRRSAESELEGTPDAATAADGNAVPEPEPAQADIVRQDLPLAAAAPQDIETSEQPRRQGPLARAREQAAQTDAARDAPLSPATPQRSVLELQRQFPPGTTVTIDTGEGAEPILATVDAIEDGEVVVLDSTTDEYLQVPPDTLTVTASAPGVGDSTALEKLTATDSEPETDAGGADSQPEVTTSEPGDRLAPPLPEPPIDVPAPPPIAGIADQETAPQARIAPEVEDTAPAPQTAEPETTAGATDEAGQVGDLQRLVGDRSALFSDRDHATLFDLGQKIQNARRNSRAPTARIDQLLATERQQIANLFGIALGRVNELADDFRYRVQRAAKSADGDFRAPALNANLIARLQAEKIEAAAVTIDEAAQAAATSPENNLPDPTEAQKEAGNYKMGHAQLGGLDFSIENPAGSTRSGTDKDGKDWSVEMKSHYGYIKGTVGRDKDHIDAFIRPGVKRLTDRSPVFVVDQVDPDGAFDEHKVMIGYRNPSAARKAYLENYDDNWDGVGSMTRVPLGEFKQWLASGDTKKPFATKSEKTGDLSTTSGTEPEHGEAATTVDQDIVAATVRSKEWKKVFGSTTNIKADTDHYAHHESEVAFDRVKGWLDGKAGKDPADPKPRREGARVPYLEGYIGGRFGKATQIRNTGNAVELTRQAIISGESRYDPENIKADKELREQVDLDRMIPRELKPQPADTWAQDLGINEVDLGDKPGERARDIILEREAETGKEYLIAVDEFGDVIANTEGTQFAAGMTDLLSNAMADPDEKIVVHHNHPSGASLSTNDIANASLPGVHAVYAHGRNGWSYRASVTPHARAAVSKLTKGDDSRPAFFQSARRAIPNIRENPLFHHLSNAWNGDPDFGDRVRPDFNHLMSQALHDAGWIVYSTNRDASTLLDDPAIKEAYDATVAEFKAEIAQHGADDRSADAFRHPAELADLFEGPRDAATVTGAAGSDQGSESAPTGGSEPVASEPSDIYDRYNAPRLDRAQGVQAHELVSFLPEKRADSDIASYETDIADFAEQLEKRARNLEQNSMISDLVTKYAQKYAEHQRTLWGAKARVASPMITGPARFPTARNEKAIQAERKHVDRFLKWRAEALPRALKTMDRKLTAEERAADEWKALKRNIDHDVAVVRGIDAGTEPYRRSAFTNSLKGRIERAAKRGEVELVRDALEYIRSVQQDMKKPVFAARNSVWNSIEDAERNAAALEERQGRGNAVDDTRDGVRIIANYEADRLQLVFDAKPADALRQDLKKSGWRWSRANGVWQRKLTINARGNATYILDRHGFSKRPVAFADDSQKAGPRRHGLPATATHLSVWRNDRPMKAHADYKAAKAGDWDAAMRLVFDSVDRSALKEAKDAFGSDVIYVPVAAVEASGTNAIPATLALHYAKATGASRSADIVQSNKAFHTGANAMERLISRATFDGPVQSGAKYVLVDDVTVMGSTLADLASHIISGGGEVAGIVTLVNASRTGSLMPKKALLKQVERRFGDEIGRTFEIEAEALTEPEARYIRNFRDADSLRARAAKAQDQRRVRLSRKEVRRQDPKGLDDDTSFRDEPIPHVDESRVIEEVRGRLTDLKPALLASVPLNYFSELKRPNMTAVDGYLVVKRQMDAYRGKRHAAADEVAQRWLKYTRLGFDRGGKARAAELANLMHDATLGGVDPASVAKDMKEKAGYAPLRKRYEALPAAGRKLYRDVRNAYKEQSEELDAILIENVNKAFKIAEAQAEADFNKEIEKIEASTTSEKEKKQALRDAQDRYRNARKRASWTMKARVTRLRMAFENSRVPAPYFPLKRFGRYFVLVRDRDGKVMSFSRRERAAERDRLARQMRKAYSGATVEAGVMPESGAAGEMMDPGLVAEIEAIVGKTGLDSGTMKNVLDQIWQRYLETMPDLSIRKRFIHRKGTPGFDEDAMRGFSSHMFHAAHQMARLKYGMELKELSNETERQAKAADDPTAAVTLSNELKRRHEWVMNPVGGQVAQVMTSAAFVYYLGVTPAAAMVNMTQTPMLGIPILGARFGSPAKAIAALGRASVDSVAGYGTVRNANLTKEEQDALERFYESGLIDRTQSHDLAGVGETGVEYRPLRAKVMEVVSFLFHRAEVWNREVTGLASYRMARAAGRNHLDAVNEAHELTWKTHFDYSNSNRPRIMQNDLAKVALVFRQHNINMLYRLFRDFRQAFKGETQQARTEARAQLAGILGMMGLMAGVTGIAGFNLVMGLAGLVLNDDDDPVDFEVKFRKGVIDMLGPELGGVVLNGVPGHYTGAALTNRIGMPDLWFRSPSRDLQGRDEWQYWVAQLLGASVSMLEQQYYGVSQIREGNVQRGVEAIVPKFARDLLKAYRYSQEGVTDSRKNQILPAEELASYDIVMQAVGFSPARVSETWQRNSALKNAETRIKRRRQKLLNEFALAYKMEDRRAQEEILDRIAEFNAKPMHLPVAITGRTIRQSLKNRVVNEAKRIDGALIQNPRLGEMLREQLPDLVYR